MKHPRLYFVLACCLLAAPAGAATICVNPGGTSGCLSTIQAAVTAAVAGDIVKVQPGTYNENVTVPAGKDGLQIIGASKLTTILDPDVPLSGPGIFVFGSNSVQIKNLTIRNGQAYGIGIIGNGAIIQGVRIIGIRSPGPVPSGAGIVFAAGTTGHQILSNEIRASSLYGIYFFNGAGGGNSVIRGNTIVGAGVAGIFFEGPSVNNPNNQVVANKVSNVGTGVSVVGDTNTVSSNVIENVPTTGLGVQGINPFVQSNKLTAASTAIVFCIGCTGGSVKSNSSLGSSSFGLAVVADATGLVVQGNKVAQTVSTGIFLLGNGLQALLNTVADSVAPSTVTADGSCFFIGGDGHALIKNIAQRCGGAGFYVNGDNNTLNLNSATGANHNGFLVDGSGGPFANAVLTGNKALSTSGQGFAVINGAVNSTLTGNSSTKNRLDLCDAGAGTTVNPPFASTSGTCDILQ